MCPNNKELDLNSQKNNTDDDHLQRPVVKGRVVTQILACLVASLANLNASAVFGWTAETLPLMKEDPDLSMGTADVAWIASIVSVGCMIGSILVGWIMNLIGRRYLLMVMAPFLSAGWLIIALAPNTAVVLIGRMICGFASAFLFATGHVYCSETSEASLRGSLGLFPSLLNTLGALLSYIAGAFFSWRTSCYVCMSPLILMFVALWIIPESPYWYLLKKRYKDCEASIRWLRGPDYDVTAEILDMEGKINSVGREVEYREFMRPRTKKPFLIAIFLATLQQMSGANVIIMLTGVIFVSAGVENHHLPTVLTGLIQFVFTSLCLSAANCVGRRPLLMTSTFITGSATTFLGTYYLLKDIFKIIWPPWIPIASMLTAVAGYCLGSFTLPSLMTAELFNTTVRSTAQTAVLFYNRLLNFAVVQAYLFFEEEFGAHTVFFTFGGLNFLSCLVTFFVVPETKGKTLEQIQEHFQSSKKVNAVHPT